MSTDTTTDGPRYSTMDLEDCEAFYHEEIAQEMGLTGSNPTRDADVRVVE